MNEESIRQLAEEHGRELQAARDAAKARTEPTRTELWDAAFPPLIATLDQAAKTYCAVYNQAIGFERLKCANHDTSINVESVKESADAMRLHFHPTKRRVSECFIDVGSERRDFHVGASVDEHQRLVMHLSSVAVTPEELIETLLNQFTIELTRVEAEAI